MTYFRRLEILANRLARFRPPLAIPVGGLSLNFNVCSSKDHLLVCLNLVVQCNYPFEHYTVQLE